MTRGQREPQPPHIGKCPACRCAASRVTRKGVACLECCWCGRVHFADGQLDASRTVAVTPMPSGIPAGAWGDVTRSPW